MKSALPLAASLVLALTVFADAPQGTVPLASVESYPAHAVQNGIGVGARALTRKEVRKAFASDMNRCCLVIEVALYPKNHQNLQVSLDDFVLRRNGAAIKPSSATMMAAALHKKAESDRDITISQTNDIGYQSGGYDPVTGQVRRGGIYTGAGVGVGIGGGQNQASTERDRRVMEQELNEKGLPTGETAKPVAGYLYFPLSAKTKNKKRTAAPLQIEYELNGYKVTLSLP